MGNVISSTMMSSGAPSVTQLEAREVGDEIRYLGYGRAPLVSLIENSIFQDGNRKTGKGLISKRAVENVRYEMYSRSPRPYKFTVSSGTEISSSGVTLSSVVGLQPYFTLFNPRTNTTCRVETINTGTGAIKGTSVGATTFSCEAGDVLLLGAPAMPEGSTEAPVLNGTDDNNFNILQISRWSVSISWVYEAIKMIAGGQRFPREKMYLVWEALADMERTLLFSDYTGSYSSKNTTTGAQTNYTGEFMTTKGLLQLAANSYNAEGSLTPEKWRKNIPLALGDTINDNDELIAFVGNEQYARMQEWVADKLVYTDGSAGNLKQFGIKSENFVTSGPTIKLVKHQAFNVAGLSNKMIIWAPNNIGYVHQKGYDLKPNNGIQTNATHGKQDEIFAHYGLETKDAGQSILVVSNCF